MTHVPAWSAIEDDLRVGLLLIAETCRSMIGIEDRGDAVASAILGISKMPEQPLDDFIKDREFLGLISIQDTHLHDCARLCYDLVTVLRPLEVIDVEKEKTEGLNWLSYYLSLIPKEAPRGMNFSGRFHHVQAPLTVLHGMAEAHLALAEYTQNLVLTSDGNFSFTPRQISFLGNVNLRTVRNAMGPKGDKAIRSGAKVGRGRGELVSSDPLDTVEWLAGRRGFNPGRLSPDWVDRHFTNIKTLEAAATLPGLVTWLNRRTTDELASVLGWPAGRVRDWIRGRAISPDVAEEMGVAARLDGVGYRKLIERLMKGPSRPLTRSKQPVAP